MKVEITDEAADKVIADTCRKILADEWCFGDNAWDRELLRAAARVFLMFFGVKGDD